PSQEHWQPKPGKLPESFHTISISVSEDAHMMRFLRPTFRHGLLVVLGGFAFALAGCLGGITAFSYDSSSSLGFVGMAALFIGMLGMFVGIVLVAIAMFKKLFSKQTG